MTFLEWCKAQRVRRDAVGDFARDWVADRERPRGPARISELVAYLEDHGAIEDAVRAGIRCWNEWRIFGRLPITASLEAIR